MECGPRILESFRSQKCKCAKMYKGMGIELLSLGVNISAWIMSAKME